MTKDMAVEEVANKKATMMRKDQAVIYGAKEKSGGRGSQGRRPPSQCWRLGTRRRTNGQKIFKKDALVKMQLGSAEVRLGQPL